MQIKRFEADDMNEALRMVKHEFGDDAVILSAKTRSGGILSAFRKKGVEITAATDYSLDDPAEQSGFSRQLAEELDVEAQNDRVSLSSKPAAFVPLTGHAETSEASDSQSALKAPGGEAADRPSGKPSAPVNPIIAVDGSADRFRVRRGDGKRQTAAPFYRHLSQRRIIALVGAPGTGKTTTIAKLARHCRLVENQSVALLSMDRFRIDANSTLQKIARIMHLPFAAVRDVDQLQSALDEHSAADVVLIDTPGMGPADTAMVDDIHCLLRSAEPDETHLVVNATVRRAVLDAWIETFRPMGIDHLIFTHMDEYGVDDGILDLIDTHRLPSAFYTDGVDLFDHLQETTVDALDRFCRFALPKRERVTDFPTRDRAAHGETTGNHDEGEGIHFVANRNSELFHRADCKSVKRINAENIIAFDTIGQAMEEGFKPCRACCSSEMIKKAAPDVFAHRRVSAI